MKERCQYCAKPGDTNPGKKKKHPAACRELPNVDVNENIAVDSEKVSGYSDNDEEEDAAYSDNNEEVLVKSENDEEEAFVLDDDDYHDMIIDKPSLSEVELEITQSELDEDMSEECDIVANEMK